MKFGKYFLCTALSFGAANYSAAGEAEKPEAGRLAGIEEAVMKNNEFDEGKADTEKSDGMKKVGENVFITLSEYLGDVNGNGEIDAEELKDLGKRKFSKKDKITFFVCIKDRKGGKLEFALRNVEGNRVAKGAGGKEIDSDNFLTGHKIDAEQFAPGKYYGCWYVDGKLVGNNYSVEITE